MIQASSVHNKPLEASRDVCYNQHPNSVARVNATTHYFMNGQLALFKPLANSIL
jgi:hypothetical protein